MVRPFSNLDGSGQATFGPAHVILVGQHHIGDMHRAFPLDDGTLRMGRQPGLFDPLIALTVAAAATSTIRLGTGVLILPIREPLTLAQQVVSLDHASHGRFDLGIGVGWLREEFEALLGRKVDVVSWRGIEESTNPYRRNHILKHARRMYENG